MQVLIHQTVGYIQWDQKKSEIRKKEADDEGEREIIRKKDKKKKR